MDLVVPFDTIDLKKLCYDIDVPLHHLLSKINAKFEYVEKPSGITAALVFANHSDYTMFVMRYC